MHMLQQEAKKLLFHLSFLLRTEVLLVAAIGSKESQSSFPSLVSFPVVLKMMQRQTSLPICCW
jgi:hypothetical protein